MSTGSDEKYIPKMIAKMGIPPWAWDAQHAIKQSETILAPYGTAALERYHVELAMARLEGLTQESEYRAFENAWQRRRECTVHGQLAGCPPHTGSQ